MEPDLPEEVVQEQEGVLDKEERVEVGWEERVPEPDLVGVVSVLTVGRKCLIK